MGFNSAFKGLKLLKKPGNGRLNNLNNLNDPVLNVLKWIFNRVGNVSCQVTEQRRNETRVCIGLKRRKNSSTGRSTEYELAVLHELAAGLLNLCNLNQQMHTNYGNFIINAWDGKYKVVRHVSACTGVMCWPCCYEMLPASLNCFLQRRTKRMVCDGWFSTSMRHSVHWVGYFT